MELNELKKSWNVLDEQLKAHPIASEEQISRIVQQCRQDAKHNLNQLQRFQQWSLCGGGAVLLLIIAAGLFLTTYIDNTTQLAKHYLLMGFLVITALVAITWDWITYRQVARIRIDTMPVAEVARRIHHFRRYIYYELWGIGTWLLLFSAIYYWYREIYLWTTLSQCIWIGCILLSDALLISLLYKKKVFKPLRRTETHLKKLHDVCNE